MEIMYLFICDFCQKSDTYLMSIRWLGPATIQNAYPITLGIDPRFERHKLCDIKEMQYEEAFARCNSCGLLWMIAKYTVTDEEGGVHGFYMPPIYRGIPK